MIAVETEHRAIYSYIILLSRLDLVDTSILLALKSTRGFKSRNAFFTLKSRKQVAGSITI